MSSRYCTQCGQPIPEESKFCTNCGSPVPTPPPSEVKPDLQYSQQQYKQPSPTPSRPTTPKPKSNLVLAILSTIFCCLPLGIPAIVFAAKVDNLWNAGQYAEAEDASRKARNWMLASIITGVVWVIICTIITFMAGDDFLDNH